MTVSLSTPVTGLAQTGLTNPTYTVVSDQAPTANGKQWAVSALGGTQTGVDIHAVSSPFTFSAFRPVTFKSLGVPNPVTGYLSQVSRNVWKFITRKGAVPLAGQSAVTALVTTTIEVPAGTDTANPEDIRAMLSFHFGCLSQQSAGIGDSVVSGVF